MVRAKIILAAALAMLMVGCVTPKNKPGSVTTPLVTQVQSENPKEKTSLVTDSHTIIDFIAPAGTTIAQKDARSQNYVTFTVSKDTPIRLDTHDTVDSRLGASDMSIGKMIAKLQSMRWVQGVGVLVLLFGAATFAYPPLRVIVGSVTTSVVIAACGLALIILPVVIVGNEVLILLGCAGAAFAYFFIHRYGKKSGEVDVLKRWVDKNGDGKVDPGEIQ